MPEHSHYVGDWKAPGKVEKYEGNTFRIETDEGKFRLVYGIHITRTDVSILDNTHAVAVEGATGSLNDDVERQFLEYGSIKLIPQMYDVMRHCEQEGKPVFLVDTTNVNDIILSMAASWGLDAAAASVIGRELYLRTSGKIKPGITRRALLQLLATGTVAHSLSGYMGLAGTVMHAAGKEEAGHKLMDAEETLDPILAKKILYLRNLIMAQKMVGVYQLFESELAGTDLPLVMGAAHFNIEKELSKSSRQRIAEIIEVVSPGNSDDLRKLMEIGRLDFNEQTRKWDFNRFDEPNTEEYLKEHPGKFSQ